MDNVFAAEINKETWLMEESHLEALRLKVNTFNTPDLIKAIEDRMPAASIGNDDKVHAGLDIKAFHFGGRGEEKSLMVIHGDVAVIPIAGPLMKTKPWFFSLFGISSTSYEAIRADLDAALGNKNIKSILMQVSSPGGTIDGLQETADKIFNARAQKPINAFIDGVATSAAYWLVSQASEVTASPNAAVGGIGLYAVFTDSSKRAEERGETVHVVRSGIHKGMGVDGAPITQEQIDMVQARVNAVHVNYVAAVARGRNVAKDEIDVLANGGFWNTEKAIDLGLVDRVSTIDEMLQGAAGSEINLLGDERMSDNAQTQNSGVDENKIREEVAAGASAKADADNQERIEAFTRAFPDDPTYAMKALGTPGMTVEKAKADYADVLAQKNKDLDAANTKLAADLEQAKASSGTDENDGIEGDGEGAGEGGGTAPTDFLAKAQDLVDSGKCKTKVEAMKRVRREDPAAHNAWIDNQDKVQRKLKDDPE